MRKITSNFKILHKDIQRKLSHKRKLNKLEAEHDFLQQLVNTLRDSSDNKALQLLGLIRSQVPPAEIQLYIKNIITDRDRQQNFHRPSLHRAPTIKQLPSPPVYHVPTEPWTSVTKSDDFVLYLINRDLFLCNARTGNLSSQYCSPFLINCILTEYLGQLRSLAADNTETDPLLVILTPNRAILPIMFSGVYIISQTTSITWTKYLAITQPDRSRLPCDHGPDDTWTPYPRQANPVQSHIACVFNNLCELSTINTDASALVSSSGQIPPPDSRARTLQKIRARLDRWRDNLPECLTLENVTVPHALTLRMVYHAIIIILWGLFKEPGDAAKAGTESMTFAAREVCVDAAESVVQLLRIYRAKWGIDYMCLTTVSCLSTALFTLLSELGDLGRKSAFAELCVVARACSRRWPLMKGLMRMLQLSARKNHVSLLPETHALFIDFEATIWERCDDERFKSIYPNFSI
ncbi:C6 transcription factor [Aspergillus ellipticus CBS 707.79]|uniref:C6 transcription factor n=1 Tax=Aspergillus ellipticus CBS 707.79 TaxID=1448320 RepID=A0A319D1C5_9EURO|nr:C6 transcription factor [Aspergillus ellipticus CBS 707.79]